MKRLLWMLITVSLMLLITGCGEKSPIQIGIVGTMSGTGSDLAVTGRRGAEIAVKEINDAGGINGRLIKLVVKDDLNDKEVSLLMVEEFINEGVQLVIGPYTSSMMLAANEKVTNSNILYMSPTVSSDTLSGIDDHFIRFIASTQQQAEVLTSVAIMEKHMNMMVVIDHKNDGFSEALYQNFKTELSDAGGHVFEPYYYNKLTNETLEIICNLGCEEDVDGVLIIANASDFAHIAQEFYKNSIEVQLYGPLWAHTSDLLMFGGASIEGAYLVGAIDEYNTKEEFRRVNSVYRNTYGSDMTFSSVYTYEGVMAIKEAILAGESNQWQDIKTQLLDIGEFNGLQEKFELDIYGDCNRDYIVEEIIGGSYRRVKR